LADSNILRSVAEKPRSIDTGIARASDYRKGLSDEEIAVRASAGSEVIMASDLDFGES